MLRTSRLAVDLQDIRRIGVSARVRLLRIPDRILRIRSTPDVCPVLIVETHGPLFLLKGLSICTSRPHDSTNIRHQTQSLISRSINRHPLNIRPKCLHPAASLSKVFANHLANCLKR